MWAMLSELEPVFGNVVELESNKQLFLTMEPSYMPMYEPFFIAWPCWANDCPFWPYLAQGCAIGHLNLALHPQGATGDFCKGALGCLDEPKVQIAAMQ